MIQQLQMSVVIETTIGDFTVDLFLQERPRACLNFLKLCKLKYYNFSLFHTVQRDFIAQTGDPTGTGRGGTSLFGILYGDQAKYFEAEKTPKLKHSGVGTLSFVSHGDNMLGSQFLVTLAADLGSLDGQHCVFGRVADGLDVLVTLNDAICDGSHQPYQDIRVTHTVVLDDPLDDPAGLPVPDRSPALTEDVLKSGRIAADEPVDDTAGRAADELDEMLEQREAAARATILEMVGDLPDADAAPPENVLFVCKLNPVTTDDDLKIIFSRFGNIVSCEIIRDQRTKNSLQYGFIEFDNPKSCETAYFKMDNVLIDDRRIHVDFSQSVAHVRWRGRGRVSYQNGASAGQFGDYAGGLQRPPGGSGGSRGGPRPPPERREPAGRPTVAPPPPAVSGLDVQRLRALLLDNKARKRDEAEGAKHTKSKKGELPKRRKDSERESSSEEEPNKTTAHKRDVSVNQGEERQRKHDRSTKDAPQEHRKRKSNEKQASSDRPKKSKKKRKKRDRSSDSISSDSSSSSDEKSSSASSEREARKKKKHKRKAECSTERSKKSKKKHKKRAETRASSDSNSSSDEARQRRRARTKKKRRK